MPFTDILEQESAKRHLQSALRKGQLAGAYLFHGPWGVGKTRTALLFARALNCETRVDDACDACPSCRKNLRFLHRDVQFYFPVPGGKEEEVETIERDTREAFAADPYYVIQFERFASISIDKVRELKRLAGLMHAEGRHKVAVLREADRMLDVQQNALLKLLEEPPADTHLVLTSSRPQALLPTIVSRCQAVTFAALSQTTIAGVLARGRGLDPARAQLAAGMAEGSLARALLLAGQEQDLLKVRDRALEVLAAAGRGGSALLQVGEAIAAEKDRNLVRRLAHALALWHRDLLRVRWGDGGAGESLANPDRRKELEAQAERLDLAEVRRRLDLCDAVVDAIDSNANLSLVVDWLLVSLRDPELSKFELPLEWSRG
jgi:DNA polymerase-3 subunit delta'